MNIYLASAFENKLMLNIIKMFLEEKNQKFSITSNWICDQDKDIKSLKQRASIDFKDVDNSDLLVVFYPYGPHRGAICEMSYAIAKNIPVIYLVPQEFFKGLDSIDSDPLCAGLLEQWSDYTKFNPVSKGYIVHRISDFFKCLNSYVKDF